MNLSEALDAALPEMPYTRMARSRPPRLDPDLVVREDLLDGESTYAIMQRNMGNFFRLSPEQWQLASLFDGIRSYEEIAELYSVQTGMTFDSEYVRLFAENLEQANFWYKSPQEKNLAMSQKLIDQRSRRAARTSKVSLAHIGFSAWDPDQYLGWLDRSIGRYIYSPWCVLCVVILFVFEASVFIAKWSFIGPDIALFYNFTHKGFMDFVQFWLLILVLGFIHETAHGLTCKHFGGQVHSMGLMFLYLAPCFYVDVTEVWIAATKVQRLATIIAGIWIEMVICGLAMIVWSNTLTGQWVHDFAYQIILITGIAVVVINLNPLIKLDGYYFMTEVIGIPDLKERSTAFLSGWFQSRILRLPVETPVVPRRRAPLFILYAAASGAYSYLLLFFVIRFSYNLTSKWLAEFALIPAGWLAFAMFRSRLRSLGAVTNRLREQHFGADRKWRPIHTVFAICLVGILFVPFWRDREDVYYTIGPNQTNTLHAAVSGRIDAVLVREDETVSAGQPLLRMSGFTAASMHSAAVAQTEDTRFRTVTAELHGDSIGAAAAQQTVSTRYTQLAGEAESSLVIRAPVDGVVLTKDPSALLDQDVASGQPLLKIADAGPHIALIYIPVSALDRIHAGAEIALALPDSFSIIRMPLAPFGSNAVDLPPGLIASQEYKGIKLPVFYCARMALPPSANDPRIGVSGQAKVFGARRSVAGRFATTVFDLVKAHFW
jgi:putative peptide zinc metalloprotease protein